MSFTLTSLFLTNDGETYLSWQVGQTEVKVCNGLSCVPLEKNLNMFMATERIEFKAGVVACPLNAWDLLTQDVKWSGGTLLDLIELMQRFYAQLLTAEIKEQLLLVDPLDRCGYIKNAVVGQSLAQLMGERCHFDGFRVNILSSGCVVQPIFEF